MKNAIITNNLSKDYGKFKALDNVSIHVEQSGIYGLVGKNGAGKSTLFKVLMGLARPSQGEVSIEGSQNEAELNHARGNIGFMMGANFFPYLTGKQNLEYFRLLKGIDDKEEVSRVMRLVEMQDTKKKFKAYSMGMKQRISIANALMGNPDIIILDEPINGLDPQGIADIRKIIQRLNQEYGITFLISSHILGELALIGTRFGFIDGGRLIEEIDAEDLREKTRQQLLISVDDTAKAAFILENELGTKNYRVLSTTDIILSDFVNESDKVSDILFENGVKIRKIAPQESSLEDYFLNLIGGGQIV